MINIRTITYNLPKKFGNNEFNIIENCMNSWNKNRYLIRTVRINTTSTKKIPSLNQYAKLNKFCDQQNIRWFSIPLNLNTRNKDAALNFAYEIIKQNPRSFVNIDGVKDSIINLESIQNYIKLTKKVANLSLDGEENFRLGLSINKIADAPFFPFTKSSGNLSFSIGLELTQEINKILDKYSTSNFENLRKIIIKTLDKQITEIEQYALRIEKKNNITFKGFDFSLAPIIEENGSILEIVRKLGIKNFDGPGIMFATAYLTNILKSFQNNHRHLGFSGVMYSLVEDTEFSKINDEKNVKLEDIIKLSTMCGCGIDMIPISYNTPDETLISYILDIAAISCRLNKPLGVRFLPILNNYTTFNTNGDFITNTKVLVVNHNNLMHNNIKTFEFIKLK